MKNYNFLVDKKYPIFAFDFDGVIADTNSLKSNILKKKWNMDIPKWLCDKTNLIRKIGERKYKELANIVYSKSNLKKLHPTEDVRQALSQLNILGVAILLTCRPKDDFPEIMKWLDKHNLNLPFSKMFSVSKVSKIHFLSHFTNNIKFIIDDDKRHLLNNIASDITSIELKLGCKNNKRKIKSFQLVKSWEECLQSILPKLHNSYSYKCGTIIHKINIPNNFTILVMGQIGAKKTIISKSLATYLNMNYISTDSIRNKLSLNADESSNDLVYKTLFDNIKSQFHRNKNTIIEGTFCRDEWINTFLSMSEEAGFMNKIVFCYSPFNVRYEQVISKVHWHKNISLEQQLILMKNVDIQLNQMSSLNQIPILKLDTSLLILMKDLCHAIIK